MDLQEVQAQRGFHQGNGEKVRLRADRRSERQKEAVVRNAAWEALSLKEKVEQLNIRLGPGVGAKRQRTKLVETKQ